jgi:hypothetical protein
LWDEQEERVSNGINTALVTWAWEALWNPSKPYYLPTILLNGLSSGTIHVDPVGNLLINELSMPDLLDKEPWGTIGVDLTNCVVTGVNTMTPDPNAAGSFTYNETTGVFTGKIKFSTITFSGDYAAKTGGLLGCAVDVAAVGSKIIDPVNKNALRASASASDQVAPLDSARNYRTQLLQSDNGSAMVQTYYENNNTYAELFGYPAFAQVWAGHTTNGQTTQYYGLQTNDNVQPGATAPINGQPDAQGNSPYNAHSFFMQNFLMSYCYNAASHFGTSSEKGQRYTKAGNDAGTFGVNVQPQSAQSMNAPAVMSAVSTGTPETSVRAVVTGPGTFLQANHPSWLHEIHDRAASMAADAAAKDFGPAAGKAGLADVQTGITINGSFTDTISGSSTLTLNGTITFSGSTATVNFTSLDGDLGPIHITLSKPTGVNSDLFTAISQAIANTSWVTGMLSSAVKSKLNDPSVLSTLNQVMNLGISKALGG